MKNLFLFILALLFHQAYCQPDTIGLWNFNSVVADDDLNTGDTAASIGNGKIYRAGKINYSYASGKVNGSSSDPAKEDNSALSTNTYAPQGTADKTCGLELEVSLTGYKNIRLQFDVRHSNTSSRFITVQYNTDNTGWTDARVFEATAGADHWYRNITTDLSEIPGLNDNSAVRFRIVSSFAPGLTVYKATATASNYTPAGTLRFDMITLLGDLIAPPPDLEPPLPINVEVISSDSLKVVFNERITPVTAGNIKNYAGLEHLSAARPENDSVVILVFRPSFPQGIQHSLLIKDISDTAGNVMPAPVYFSVFFNASAPALVITEIMYNPAGEDDLEYLELYNNSNDTAYTGGFYFSGIKFSFKPGHAIAPHSYFLLAENDTLASQTFDAAFTKWGNSGLLNTGECIVLYNMEDETIDKVCYDNAHGWPKAADGKGPSLELRELSADNDLAESWRASFTFLTKDKEKDEHFGSPGFGYSRAEISFKSGEFIIKESGGRLKVPLITKYATAKVITRARLKGGSATAGTDFSYVDVPVIAEPGKPAYIELNINDDNFMEQQENVVLELYEVNNGKIKGFPVTDLIIRDNDQVSPAICINEVMVQNTGITDPAGDHDSWIELHNPNTYAVSLDSYYTGNSFENAAYSELSGLTLLPGAFLLLWADAEPEEGIDHLGFVLPGKDGVITLAAADGKTIVDSYTYRNSRPGVSLGLITDCGDQSGSFANPTPGSSNSTTGVPVAGCKNFAIYPNPLAGNLLRLEKEQNISIYNITGQFLIQSNGRKTIDLSALPGGIYYLVNEQGVTVKLVKY